MKVYRCAGSFEFFKNLHSGELYSHDANRNKFLYSNEKIKYRKYDKSSADILNYCFYKGFPCEIFWTGEGVGIKQIEDGKVYLLDQSGVKVTLDSLTLRALVSTRSSPEVNGMVLFRERGFPTKYDFKFFLVNVYSGANFSSDADLRSPALLDDGVYGWSSKSRVFAKYNLSFQKVWCWSLDPEFNVHMSGTVRSWTPALYNDQIIVYLGHIQDEILEHDGERGRKFKRGLLYSFCKDTGSVKWHREFEYAVEDTLLHNDYLFVATANKIEVLNPGTGETARRIDTGLVTGFSRGAGGEVASLHVDGDHLYYCYRKETCLLVFDIATLEQRYRLDLPEGWCSWHFQFKDENTGRLYFDLILGETGAPDYHRNAVLEFHPDELGQPVVMEPSPETRISMRPSAEEPDKDEVWVEIRCPVVDDALRFGELHTQNQAYIQGHTLVAYHSEPNPRFNGMVHFRYSGSELPATEVREKLKIMEQRFEKWNDNAAVYAGDRSKRLCRLDAQYVEIGN